MRRLVYSCLFVFAVFNLSCDSAEPEQPEPLAITSSPARTAPHNVTYAYRIVTDSTSQSSPSTTIEVQEKPSWLQYDESQNVLSGMPGAEGLGSHSVRIRLSNGEFSVTQAFTIDVVRGDLIFDGSWNSAFRVNLGHDGLTYESENFIIYSDFSRVSAREQLADLFEEALTEHMQRLDVTKADFEYLPGQSKIEIYADYDQTNRIGLAYRDGIIMRALDSPGFSGFGHTIESYKRLIRHELMHVIEFLLIGKPQYQQASDVWFREGFANYMGGPFPSTITTVQQVEDWQARYSGTTHLGNPIQIHVWSDFPSDVLANQTTIEYYAFFELALYYLLSPGGGDATLQDVVSIYDDMGAGKSFDEALQTHIGVDLAEFETNYFDLVKVYLATR